MALNLDEQLEIVHALKVLHKVHSASGDPCTKFSNETGQCDVYVLTVHRDPELYRQFQELFTRAGIATSDHISARPS